MALKITCPHCNLPVRIEEPYPLPGAERQCACGKPLVISYRPGTMEFLRSRGARFEGDEDRPGVPPGKASGTASVALPPPPARPAEATPPAPRKVAPLVPPAPVPEPTAATELAMPPASSGGGPSSGAASSSRSPTSRAPARGPVPPAERTGKAKISPPKKNGGRLWRWTAGLFAGGTGLALALLVLGAATAAGVAYYYGRELPSVEALEVYRPPTVTVVYDQNGELMGEIYQKRRYVVELSAMPKHLLEAFISAEDAAFYDHGGIDYLGIVRAVGRNAMKGKKAQGASTITQQVARNFLLTSEKTFSRKIKEALLAKRIESTFDKEHILHLYLNQIYLGSGAYGVEAAARVYFGKHVGELDLAESAMIAGLPQRPSDYSPHRHFEKAKSRQDYVLTQMAENGYIDAATAKAALDQPLTVVARKNEFLLKAPWFTEHIRRDLVAKYGEERVYNDGLIVHATCNLALQREAQRAVTAGVGDAEEKIGGWRGASEHLEGSAVTEKIASLTQKIGEVVEGEWYTAVVTDVQKKHALVDLGGVKGIIPLAWTTWAHPVAEGETMSRRRIDDLNAALRPGDVVTVEVENRDFRSTEALKTYKDAGDGPYVAVSLFQEPLIQGALWSYRIADGAVLAMVGGVDFKDTQFNRATQAVRQVGSTFKPIVYAAAIESRKFTAGTIVQDAPLVYNTLRNQLWKPANYGEDYLGDITLRRALALSRNVVTVRVLDAIGLDPVYQLARNLGIESHMDVDLSMGLGSASLTIPELARAYSAFATGGRKVDPHYIDRVLDRDGQVLEQYTPPAEWPQVLDPAVADITHWLLVEVATAGTAAKSTQLGL
ncbi:MAG: PBP1A family penicillin-binding protein, partial [Deltaproteobacteria bacterium]|nr:PBP1A family penicillin-binding protein [Deltaproteobacteria bacterium]